MDGTTAQKVTWVDHLVGWWLLLMGLALLATGGLMPLLMERRDLAWQRDLMLAQARTLEDQQRDYRLFDEALASEDPTLLARLAYQQLRLKPAGSVTLAASPQRNDNGAVEAWLHQPLPTAAADSTPPPARRESSLVRLTTGRGRVVCLALGLLSLVMGLVIPGEGSDQVTSDQ